MMTIRQVNTKLKAARPELELVWADGYHYFIFDAVEAHNVYETHSVYIVHTSAWSVDRWVTEGLQFAERIKEERGI